MEEYTQRLTESSWGIDLGMQNYLSLESRGVNLWDQFQEGQRWEVFRLGNMHIIRLR